MDAKSFEIRHELAKKMVAEAAKGGVFLHPTGQLREVVKAINAKKTGKTLTKIYHEMAAAVTKTFHSERRWLPKEVTASMVTNQLRDDMKFFDPQKESDCSQPLFKSTGTEVDQTVLHMKSLWETYWAAGPRT